MPALPRCAFALPFAPRWGEGWSALLEGAGVASAGDHYNSGANGQAQYPAITDPRGSELNQAWLGWQGDEFGATLGRQRILLDNQRWVGNSGWRQFEQTYDGIALQWQPASDWTVRYDWLDRVHRVAGPDAINPLARERKLDASLLNAAYVRGEQTWVGYAYLHEDRDVSTASTATFGLRWTGSHLRGGTGPGWTLEFARQTDYANNPASYATSYWLFEPSWTLPALTAKLGWEHLGGDGTHALQTPLATLHAFNGWDDQFNATPPGGLEDRYLGLNRKFGRGQLAGKLAWASRITIIVRTMAGATAASGMRRWHLHWQRTSARCSRWRTTTPIASATTAPSCGCSWNGRGNRPCRSRAEPRRA